VLAAGWWVQSDLRLGFGVEVADAKASQTPTLAVFRLITRAPTREHHPQTVPELLHA
jgi:hypothetical protein